MRGSGYKGSSINQYSVHAERLYDLSEIDSKFYNGEWSKDRVQKEMILWADRTGNTPMLPALFATLQ